jgi:hypothetical protein
MVLLQGQRVEAPKAGLDELEGSETIFLEGSDSTVMEGFWSHLSGRS